MIYLPQKLLAQTDRSTLSLLMIIAELGKGKGRHRMMFVHRQDGQIVSVEDYDYSLTKFHVQDLVNQGETLIAQYTDDDAPETRCKVRTIESSDGEFYLEFLNEKTAIKKIPGGYEVLRQTPPNQQVNYANPGSSAITAL